MFCQYRWRDIEELKTAVAHSDEKYQCEEMSDCPYTGITLINKIPWGDWPADDPRGPRYGIQLANLDYLIR